MNRIALSFLGALALAATSSAVHAQDILTACHKASSGTLKKFAFGEEPQKPCKDGKEEPVSLVVAGFCGNGAVEAGEVCDDGNTVGNDGCSATCAFEAGTCGDGNVGLSEQCDDGNVANGDGCTSQCLGEADLAEIPFYVVLDADNSESTIATYGEFRLFVRCRVNQGGNDVIRVMVTRTSAGWFTDNAAGTSQAAGAEVEMSVRSIATNTANAGVDFDEGYALGPDGTYVALDADGLALGLNVFGHRCVAAGIVRAMTGFIPEVPVP
jgi:cysteine-rich repeat protein